MATLSAEARANRLYDMWKSHGESGVYGIHTLVLPDQGSEVLSGTGRSFAFDGPMELDFAKELQKRKSQPLKVLIPAMGSGRTVMDVLTLHQEAEVYANDIRHSAFEHLQRLISEFGNASHIPRIHGLEGDIEKALDVIAEQSIDFVYCANLFHFLDPEKVERILTKLKGVLKPGGKIFLAWRGTPTAGYAISLEKSGENYLVECKFLQALEISKQKELKVPHPRYLKTCSIHESQCTYPYYAATVADMVSHAEKTGFRAVSRGENAMFAVTLRNGVMLGEFQTMSVEGKPADIKAPIVNHLVLEHFPSSSSKAAGSGESQGEL